MGGIKTGTPPCLEGGVRKLALTLLVLRVFADYADDPFAHYDGALVANLLDGRTDFHREWVIFSGIRFDPW